MRRCSKTQGMHGDRSLHSFANHLGPAFSIIDGVSDTMNSTLLIIPDILTRIEINALFHVDLGEIRCWRVVLLGLTFRAKVGISWRCRRSLV